MCKVRQKQERQPVEAKPTAAAIRVSHGGHRADTYTNPGDHSNDIYFHLAFSATENVQTPSDASTANIFLDISNTTTFLSVCLLSLAENCVWNLSQGVGYPITAHPYYIICQLQW